MQYAEDEVIAAIAGSNGIKAFIARRLGMARDTLERYIDRYPKVKEAYVQEREAALDIAESKLFELINAKDPEAIRFFLRTVGKHRGYSERVETEHSGTVSIAPAPVVTFNADFVAPALPQGE